MRLWVTHFFLRFNPPLTTAMTLPTPLLTPPPPAAPPAGAEDFYLSQDFCSHHFLVGALLTEVRAALGEVGEVQRVAIAVLRDLLAKHAFDDRYLQSVRKKPASRNSMRRADGK